MNHCPPESEPGPLSLASLAERAVASPKQVQLVNARLDAARLRMRPLELSGVSLGTSHVHIGGGEYPEGRNVGAHRHRELQLEYVLRGRVRFVDAKGESFLLTSGCGALIGPGMGHSWSCEDAAVMMGVLIRPTGREADAFNRGIRAGLRGGMRLLDAPWSVALARDVFELAVAARPRVWCEQRMSGLLEAWFARWLEVALALEGWSGGEACSSADGPCERLCRQAIQFIEDNYDQPLQLEEVALQAGCSPRHLTRLLRERRDTCFGELLQECRMRHARGMLEANESLAIKEVAYACGFAHPAYFSACFKRRFGMPPSQVRRS